MRSSKHKTDVLTAVDHARYFFRSLSSRISITHFSTQEIFQTKTMLSIGIICCSVAHMSTSPPPRNNPLTDRSILIYLWNKQKAVRLTVGATLTAFQNPRKGVQLCVGRFGSMCFEP